MSRADSQWPAVDRSEEPEQDDPGHNHPQTDPAVAAQSQEPEGGVGPDQLQQEPEGGVEGLGVEV